MKILIAPVTRAAAAAVVAAATLAVPHAAGAQEAMPTREEMLAFVEAARAEMRASREQLIAANMSLTEAEAAAFWPLYREFNLKKAELGDERLQIILAYADKYPDVDDATAKDLIDRSLKFERRMHKLEDSYAGKFGKVLPPTKLMRFLQIDSRIDTLVELEVQRAIPVVEPKE